MRKISIVVLLLILFAVPGLSQREYSKFNLEHSSEEELEQYLKKAKHERNTGLIFSVAGTAVAIAGTAIVFSSDFIFLGNQEKGNNAMFNIGYGMFCIGTISVLGGIPTLIINSARLSKIKKIKRSVSNEVYFELAPCRFHNNLAPNYQSGITFRLRF